jgi:hypothetical protein
MSVTVVHVPRTGHVVGALSGTGLAAEPEVSDLVGAGLVVHLWTEDHAVVDLPLPADALVCTTLPKVQGPIIEPMAHGLSESTTGGPTLTRLTDWRSGQPTLTLTNAQLTLELPAPVTEDTDVLVVVSGAAAPLEGTIDDGKNQVVLPVTSTAGAHGVLALVPGRFGWLDLYTVS